MNRGHRRRCSGSSRRRGHRSGGGRKTAPSSSPSSTAHSPGFHFHWSHRRPLLCRWRQPWGPRTGRWILMMTTTMKMALRLELGLRSWEGAGGGYRCSLVVSA